MRASDVARLSEAFSADEESPDARAMSALGLDLEAWKGLETAIFDDFVERPPYGIAWWTPGPGTRGRILIGDQLYACTVSVSSNMIEAALHWLEYLDCVERDSDRFADAVQQRGGLVTLSPPPPRNPMDELSRNMVAMHIAGIARALSAALDCLAGTIIGVLALSTPILKADLDRVRKLLGKIGRGSTDGQRVQAQFADRFEALIALSGPLGWLDWMLSFRNMLVHRGRRLEMGQFLPRAPLLYGADAQPVQRCRRATHLPRDPGRSDVEVWREAPCRFGDHWHGLVLSEEAAATLTGLSGSAKNLINLAAGYLAEVWNWRRANPSALPQPSAQWPKGPATQAVSFAGYAPGSLPLSPSMAMLHPTDARRFRAAALDDAARPQWSTFD
jgi:hypothetical protein